MSNEAWIDAKDLGREDDFLNNDTPKCPHCGNLSDNAASADTGLALVIRCHVCDQWFGFSVNAWKRFDTDVIE